MLLQTLQRKYRLEGKEIGDWLDSDDEGPSRFVDPILDRQRKRDALAGSQFRQQAIDEVCQLLQSTDAPRRYAAVEAFTRIAERGDEQAVEALLGRLERPWPETPWTPGPPEEELLVVVLDALGRLAGAGDERALGGIMPKLEHKHPRVRIAAAQAFVQLAWPDDQRTLGLVVDQLEDQEVSVRSAAIQNLVTVAAIQQTPEERAEVFAYVARMIEHPDWDVRLAAVQALGRMAEPGEELAIAEVSPFIINESGTARASALEAIGLLAIPGDPRAVEVIMQSLADEDPLVKIEALGALGRVAPPGDQQVVSDVAALLNDSDARVRSASKQALLRLVPEEDEACMEILRFAWSQRDTYQWVPLTTMSVDTDGQEVVQGDMGEPEQQHDEGGTAPAKGEAAQPAEPTEPETAAEDAK